MTTNNHPANGPVSLDRLHQIREILSKAAAQSDGGNLGYAMSDAVKVIDVAIAEFGSAPVAINDDMAYAFHHALSDSSLGSDEIDEIKTGLRAAFANVTAPPAPVYQYREIGGGVWEECGKDWFEHCSQSPEHDTRTLYAAKQPAPIVPDTLPCPVHLEPGLKFGKGVRTQCMLDALRRRADYYAELESMTPEQRAEHDSGIAEFKAMLGSAHGKSDDEIGSWNNHVNTPTAQAGNSPVTPDGWCRTCRPVTMNDMRVVVCPECGNKRCPHANDHRNDCTGSNEPGQVGSAYPAAPQQEVNRG
ncbi:hypothetical protein OGW08_16980 [Citrobacter sp. Cf122]|uniref:hypothetical protein n=1 Tax=Citrobacter sp. Cf122 TaxID=2985072 RepID=UPI002574FD0C|nr:hypothetical protein [Citrobacter sp. Cf122]MDM3155765.1 hypothetical protein [Citrobacter sp. Cf122]